MESIPSLFLVDSAGVPSAFDSSFSIADSVVVSTLDTDEKIEFDMSSTGTIDML